MESDAENAAAPKTTQWMKPNDILKLTKAAKRRLQPRALQPVSLNAINGATTVPVKRERSINPFRCPVQKKPRLEEVYALLHRTTASPPNFVATGQFVFRAGLSGLLGINRHSRPAHNLDVVGRYLRGVRLVVSKVAVDSYDDETRHSLAGWCKAWNRQKRFVSTQTNKDVSVTAQPPKLPGLPLDWSLKTRIRFCSTSHFPWSGSLKTCEEASGTTGFVRAVHSTGCEESAAEHSSSSAVWKEVSVLTEAAEGMDSIPGHSKTGHMGPHAASMAACGLEWPVSYLSENDKEQAWQDVLVLCLPTTVSGTDVNLGIVQ
ncbi:hypothetical protein MRX96_049547 [Rhipicephalus microplus]